MDRITARKEIENLTREIEKYNKAYFQEAKSLVSDYEYDQMVARLEKLESLFPQHKAKTSPTQFIGEAPSTSIRTVEHTYPMYSLRNTYEEAEVVRFVDKLKKMLPEATIDFFCELKLDGVALNLVYQKGRPTKILTRGDGVRGNDITFNLSLFKNLPKIENVNCPDHIEIRGEALMLRVDFHQLNQLYKEKGRAPLANPRNATAGLLRNQKIEGMLKANPPLVFLPLQFYKSTCRNRNSGKSHPNPTNLGL